MQRVDIEGESQQVINRYLASTEHKTKDSFCRFYLRGICIFDKEQCHMAHGIDDIKYVKPQKLELNKEYWSSTVSPFNEKPLIRGNPRYFVLYKEQYDTNYTLEQIQQNKQLRYQLRRRLHHREFQKFLRLLKREFDCTEFKEQLVEHEYYRLGFNKLMTRIKFGHLTQYMCDLPNSKFFKIKNNGIVFIQRLSPQEMIDGYAQVFSKAIQQIKPEKIVESQVRSWLYKMNSNVRLPPLNLLLTWLNMDFNTFLNALLDKNGQQFKHLSIKQQFEQCYESVKQYLRKEQRILPWCRVQSFVKDNLNIQNIQTRQALYKGILQDNGLTVYQMPVASASFILNSLSMCASNVEHQCKCGRIKDLPLLPEIPHVAASDIESVLVITSVQQIDAAFSQLNEQKIVGVDVEGRLRKNATIQIIQIRSPSQVYLFDFLSMDSQSLKQVKLQLRSLLENHNIWKVFHDSRHDSLAIHEVINSCIVNVIDTSAVHTYLQQRDGKTGPAQSPGLNEVLKYWQAPHGINLLKDRMHELMASKDTAKYFLIRPIERDYMNYCIKDVEDLPWVGSRMAHKLPKQLVSYLGGLYVAWGHQSN